mmetsp:Transcript_70655/g.169314  ORF Transcript_70655/g.169314 Transcript_70655/m.169314 type:complete len:198 (-) Transcript_70655:120-713(-)
MASRDMASRAMTEDAVKSHEIIMESTQEPVNVSCAVFLEALFPGQKSKTRDVGDADGNYDLDGLVAFLDQMKAKKKHFSEVTYMVNRWSLAGLFNFEHHGFVLKTAGEKEPSYLSLDFGMKGILWEVFEVFPDLPDGTFHVETFTYPIDPAKLREYCVESEPFSFFGNDCATWSNGLKEELEMRPERGVVKPVRAAN